MPALPDTAVCLHCGYALRGLPGNICPECGRAFDPADRRTYYDTANRRTIVQLARRWSSPPPRWHACLTIGVTLLLLTWMAVSLWPFLPQYAGYTFWDYSAPIVLMGTVLLFPLSLSYGLRWFACRRFRRGPESRSSLAWWVLPCCLMALVSASLYPWPFAVRFCLSYPSLERAGRDVVPNEPVAGLCWLGAFQVNRISSGEANRVRYYINSRYDIHRDMRAAPESPHYVLRIGSKWYVWAREPLYSRWPCPADTSRFPPNPLIDLLLQRER